MLFACGMKILSKKGEMSNVKKEKTDYYHTIPL